MEKYISPNKFLQFELWNDCKIGCKFCCNKGQKDINKIKSLNFYLNKLNDLKEIQQYNEIGFIGGEFFNGELKDPKVKELFYKLFEKISKLHFKKIYFTTSLIFDRNLYLVPFLEYLKELNVLDKCLLCTSYDFKYRFNIEQKLQYWKDNMNFLHKIYPELKLHTEIILMECFMNKVLNNEFSILEFKEKYHTEIDYIEPASGLFYKNKEEAAKDLLDFFPKKSTFEKFIIKTCIKSNEIDLSTFLSMELRANVLYYIDDGEILYFDDRRNTDGLIRPKNKYIKYETGFIDSDESLYKVLNKFRKILV